MLLPTSARAVLLFVAFSAPLQAQDAPVPAPSTQPTPGDATAAHGDTHVEDESIIVTGVFVGARKTCSAACLCSKKRIWRARFPIHLNARRLHSAKLE